MYSCMLSCFRRVWLCASLWTVVCQTPLSMGFSCKHTGVDCHALLQEIFPTQGSSLHVLHVISCRGSSKPDKANCGQNSGWLTGRVLIEKEHEGARWVLRMVCVWVRVVGTQVCIPVKGHQAVHVRCMFLLWMELYLTKRIKTPVALSSSPKTRLDSKEKISELELMKNIQNLPQKGKKLKNNRH